ncbi:MAG: short chain dehydrogenase [Acidimicrobiia bacterium]|nr:MAG: short chain dehydrogenase [Acidimicrobiia bacterium]
MPDALAGKVALVTGAGSGIGRAIARRFAARGARVVLADVDESGALGTLRELEGEGAVVRGDVTVEDDVAAMVDAAVGRFGRLDCAVNNAGIAPAPKAFTDHTLAEWQRTIDVDLTGVFLCMQHEIRRFLAQGGGGAIVNVSSGAGVVPAPGQPQYTAAKHGVLGLTKQAAQEYGRQGIRVNAVLPGTTETPALRAHLDASPGLEDRMRRLVPLGRLGTADEVARAAVWLCSDDAAYVSGASLLVDGATIAR